MFCLKTVKAHFSVFALIVFMFSLGFLFRPFIVKNGHRIYNKIENLFINKKSHETKLYPRMTFEQINKINSAIKITFIGDLLLLRDAVEFGFKPKLKTYNFDDLFYYAKKYWGQSDLTIGVLEGPLAGDKYPWTTSALSDNETTPLHLNFPDDFAHSIQRSGINLVTTANNHLLDRGEEGVIRTLNILDEIGLDHVGSYRNKDEYNTLKIINIKGKRIAVLAYTYGSNYYSDDYFFNEKTNHWTRPIVEKSSPFFNNNIKLVENDFKKAKATNPDLIIVLPHMGKQHQHTPDITQKTWCDIFIKNGADVILSDHPHNVQPIEWRNYNNKIIPIIHCPGNFTNSYTDYDDDGSMIVELYFDPISMKPFATSIIPLYAYGHPEGNYIGLPLFDVTTNTVLAKTISRREYKRMQKVQRIITRTAINAEINLEDAEERYFYFPANGYVRQPQKPLEINVDNTKSPLLEEIKGAKKICFVGDSITEGTMNGGVGWFEPLIENFKEKTFSRFALGSMTSQYFKDHKQNIADYNSDLYILAYGCNDIRYRNPLICAMTADEYIQNIDTLITYISQQNPSARFICIAPWMSLFFDRNWTTEIIKKHALYKTYTSALNEYCTKKNFLFINPNSYIQEKLMQSDKHEGYMVDFIHPGATKGVRLYSEACVFGENNVCTKK